MLTEPYAGVVGAETEDEVAVWSDEDSVALHGGSGKIGDVVGIV